MSFYTVLNVNPECSLLEIKQAYKELARVHHPDKAKGKSDEMFKQIALAYATLRKGRSCASKAKKSEIGKETIDSKQVIQFHCFCLEE